MYESTRTKGCLAVVATAANQLLCPLSQGSRARKP
jgi:hypothetical protein